MKFFQTRTLAAIAATALSAAFLPATPAFAQTAAVAPAAAASASAYVAPPWTYKTRQLSRNDVDKLLGNPKKLLIIDVRRPDELTKNGSFPVYLSVQIKDLPEAWAARYASDLGVKVPNHRNGVLQDVHWFQAGANDAGRIEKVELNLPKGVELTRVSDKSLSQMLASGEIDCAIIARPPTCFLQGHPDVVRLYPEYLEMEEKYYEKTKVWPIMHIISMQKKVLDESPWVARNMLNAFNESKRRSVERLMDPAVSRYPVAWLPTYMRKMSDLFGGDTFPYGIEENRPTWEQMLRYTYEQGIAKRHAKPEEIFPKGIMTSVRV